MEEKKEEKAFKPKAYTFFIIPFYYDGEWEEIHKNISRWQPQQAEMYNEDILYPYIIELFKKESPQKEGENSATNRLKIYQLHTDDKGSQSEFFFDRILGKRQVAILERDLSDKKEPYTIPFRFLNEGNNAQPSNRIELLRYQGGAQTCSV